MNGNGPKVILSTKTILAIFLLFYILLHIVMMLAWNYNLILETLQFLYELVKFLYKRVMG